MEASVEKYKSVWSNSINDIAVHYKVDIMPNWAKNLALLALWFQFERDMAGIIFCINRSSVVFVELYFTEQT